MQPKRYWASRSPDLTPADYFLLACLREKIYAEKPSISVELKQSLYCETAAFSVDMHWHVVFELSVRMYIKARARERERSRWCSLCGTFKGCYIQVLDYIMEFSLSVIWIYLVHNVIDI